MSRFSRIQAPAPLLLALLLATGACSDPIGPARPTQPEPKPVEPGKGLRPQGVYEFTVTGLGTDQVTSAARPVSVVSAGAGVNASLNPVAVDGLVFELKSVSSFTEGSRTQDGVRYATLTYRVRNATGGTVNNVTLIPNTTATTIAGTPWISLKLFNGTAASSSIAQNIVPTGAVAWGEDIGLRALYPDVLQAFTEAEIAAATLPSGVTGLFPYGFMIRNADNPATRSIPVAADTADYGGVLTFAFRFPLTSSPNTDPFSFTFWAVAYQDTETRITESLEEASDTAAARRVRERALALSATTTTVLAGSPAMDPAIVDYPGQRQICTVRTAGTAASPSKYINAPGPYSQVALLWPGESVDACAAYYRSGSPGRPATNVPFTVQARAMDRYGNTKTVITENVHLAQQAGGPTLVLPSPTVFSAGVANMSLTYTNYGYSILFGVGARNKGARPLNVAGVVRTWTAGAGTTDWHTNNNWSPAAVPMSLDSVYIPAAAPLKPVIASSVQIGGVTVEDGATLGLGAFDLTASANVTAGLTGGITATTGRLFLSGVARTVQGLMPRLRVTGTYSLTGNVNSIAPIQVDAGRLTSSALRLQASSQ